MHESLCSHEVLATSGMLHGPRAKPRFCRQWRRQWEEFKPGVASHSTPFRIKSYQKRAYYQP